MIGSWIGCGGQHTHTRTHTVTRGSHSMDKRSEISGLSRLTGSVAPQVLIPCSGDFCDFEEAEEIAEMKSDPEFNTKAEVRFACLCGLC